MNVRAGMLLVLASVLPAQQAAPVGDPFAEGVAHYRAGRFEQARAAFVAAAETPGVEAPPELLGNLALAALRVQRTADAEAAARLLAQHRDATERAWGEFLLGSAAWQRAERAVAAARLRDAEPMAWDLAVRGYEDAFQHWRRAVELQPGWPPALRNAERAQRALVAARAEQRAAAPGEARKEPEPQPEPPRPGGPAEEAAPELAQQPLPAAEVARVWQRLRRKEDEKHRSRQEAQRQSVVAGERDW